MNTRNRNRPPQDGRRQDGNGDVESPPHDRERWRAATRLATEADATIDAVLSGDSDAYLDSTRQRSGQ